jgi:hypothetical protein
MVAQASLDVTSTLTLSFFFFPTHQEVNFILESAASWLCHFVLCGWCWIVSSTGASNSQWKQAVSNTEKCFCVKSTSLAQNTRDMAVMAATENRALITQTINALPRFKAIIWHCIIHSFALQFITSDFEIWISFLLLVWLLRLLAKRNSNAVLYFGCKWTYILQH